MMVKVKCQHCNNRIQVEDMGDNCVCPVCHKYIISISEFIRAEINKNYKGENHE